MHPLRPCLAALALASAASAQTMLETRPAGAPQRLHLDLATGQLTPLDGGAPQQAVAHEVLTVDNSSYAGLFFTPATNNEFADYGFSTGSSGPVCAFTFAYASSEPDDPADPPVGFSIALYSNADFDAGDCAGISYYGTGLGQEIARFGLDGLPGDTAAVPGADVYEITVDLRGVDDGGFLLPEGGVAWTYQVTSDPFSTGPLLMTPAAPGCSPPALNPAPGTSDCLDIYSPGGGGGSCGATVQFSTPNVASLWMQIVQGEFPAPPAVLRDNGTQSATCTPLVNVALVGCTGPDCPSVTVASSGSVLDFWALSRTSAPGVPIGVDGDLLIGLPELQFLSGPAGVALGVASIPAACDLVGLELFTQGGAVAANGAISLTNAVDYVVGTP